MNRAEYNAMRAEQKQVRTGLQSAAAQARREVRKQETARRKSALDADRREAARIKQEKNAKLMACASELVLSLVKSAGGDLTWLGLMARWPTGVPKAFASRAIERLTVEGILVENVQANERVLIIPHDLSGKAV